MHLKFNAIPSTFWLSMTLGLGTSAFAQVSSISQLDYLHPGTQDVVQPDSRVFRIEIDFDSSDAEQLQLLEENGGGYLNVFLRLDPFLPPDWVVQNDFESFADEESLDGWLHSYVVGLRDLPNMPEGCPIEGIEIATFIGPEPLVEIPPGLIFDWFLVSDEEWRQGSGTTKVEDEILEDWPLPRETAMGFLTDSKGFQVDCGRTWVAPKNFPIVEEKENHCLPAAHARSLAYLAMIYNSFSIGAGGAQGLCDALATACGTSTSAGTTYNRHSSTSPDPALAGRRQVNNNRGYNINSTKDGWYDFGEDNNVDLKLYNLIEKLNQGVDVELNLDWAGASTGNHSVTVLQICRYLKSNGDGTYSDYYRVDYLEDDQGKAGAQRIVKRIWVNSDGSFRFNGNEEGQYDGYVDMYSTDRVIIPEDLNGDGEVNGADLGLVFAYWGPCFSSYCPGDVNGDGEVNGADQGLILGRWGPVRPDTAD